jgi:hypothetical protein
MEMQIVWHPGGPAGTENMPRCAMQVREADSLRPALKTKPTLNWIKDGKKIAMKKKINIGCPILFQIYVFYLKRKF